MRKRTIIALALIAALLLTAITVIVSADSSNLAPNETLLENGDIQTPYGVIPKDYADREAYPIAVFHENVWKSSTNVFASSNGGAFQTAKSLMDNNSERNNHVQIFLRSAVTVTARHSNTGQMSGTLTIDLNGQTLSNPGYLMFAAVAKKYDDIYPFTFIIKNGNISMKNAGLLRNSAYGDAYANLETAVKVMNFEFNNVNFSFTSGSTLANFLGDFTEEISTGKQAITNVAFNSCTFDMRNAIPSITMFNACDPDLTGANNTLHVSVNGGSFILNSLNGFGWYTVNTENDSWVKFGTDDQGRYLTVSLPHKSNVPDTALPLANGKPGYFNSVYSSTEGDMYTLSEFSLNAISFTPKTSIELNSDLLFNVYIPKNNLNFFNLDGRDYANESLASLKTEMIEDIEHYLVSIALSPDRAARAIPLSVNIDYSGKTVTGKYTLSIPKYAAKLVSATDTSENEKVLANDIIAYIAAAQNYFGNTNGEEIAAIETLLDPDYAKYSTVSLEGDMQSPTDGFESVTFSLDSVPSFRFYPKQEYLPESYSSVFAFRQSGSDLSFTTGSDKYGNYISVKLNAYRMCDAIDCFADGNPLGSFHISAYYEYAKKLNDEKLTRLVECFWKYAQSARSYRNEKLGLEGTSHVHHYFERSIELSVESRAYDEKICACGSSIKNYKTGLSDGDRELNIFFVGNSYTNYNSMSDIFRSIAISQGITVNVKKITKGSWHLYKYANPKDTYGADMRAILAENKFDFVFLQDGSTQTLAAIGQFYDGVRDCGKIMEENGAQVLLYQTWGRKEGHAVLEQYGHTTETMALTVAAAYEAIAKETGYTLSPVGSAFLDVYTNHPEIELYDPDLTHPSATGSYLVALCHYATLFGRSPIGISYDFGLAPETALILQTAAHNAVFGESIVTDEYRTSSEGIHAATAENVLPAIPAGSTLISDKITGDNGKIAYTDKISASSSMTDAQKKEFADTAYGVSIIGAKNMINSLTVINDALWKSSAGNRLSFNFDGNMYDITGDVDPNEPYRALITYNFGKVVNITAIGYVSGNMDGFAQAQDVYVSNDGISWACITSASYDATLLAAQGGGLNQTGSPPTDANGNTPTAFVLFDMNTENGGVYAKYVRIGIRTGITVPTKTYDINTLELCVYGKDHNSSLSAVPEGSELISKGLTSNNGYSTTGLTDEQKSALASINNGLSVIGFKTLDRALSYTNNGLWSDAKRLSATFDGNKYDINGNVTAEGEYSALITYNFGEAVTLDAIGYMSGNMDGIAQTQKVFISNDGVNWIEIGTAAYDRAGGDTLCAASSKPVDSNGKTSGCCLLFDLGGISAQYVRVGIVNGMDDAYDLDINTLELCVYGKRKK